MVTAWAILGKIAEGGRRRPGPGRRHGGDDDARPLHDDAGEPRQMPVLAKAVRRGLETPMLIGDLPFGSYERSNEQAIETATRYVKGRVRSRQLERGGPSRSNARGRSSAPESVMGHVGLAARTATSLGGYKTQGRTADEAANRGGSWRWRPPVASRSCSRPCPRRSARCSCRS